MAKEHLPRLDEYMAKLINAVELKEDEWHAAYVIFKAPDGKCYVMIATFKEDTIGRVISTRPLTTLLTELISTV